jgi:hypothetical protein
VYKDVSFWMDANKKTLFEENDLSAVVRETAGQSSTRTLFILPTALLPACACLPSNLFHVQFALTFCLHPCLPRSDLQATWWRA